MPIVLSRRWPELLLFLLGIAIRITFVFNFSPHFGYDYGEHHAYTEWFRTHSLFDLPPILYSDATYNPPIYYWLASKIAKPEHRPALSALFGSARLLLIWIALEFFIPSRRIAIRIGLALAAVLPVSVFLDGQAAPEALSSLLCTGFLIATGIALQRERSARARLRASVAAGTIGGVALLTKASVLVLIGTVGCVLALASLFSRDAWLDRLRFYSPSVLAIVLPFALASPWLLRNARDKHGVVPTPFSAKKAATVARFTRLPLSQRRHPSFVFGFGMDVLRSPFYPAGVVPKPMFFPVLIASTFSDYYGYGYAYRPDRNDTSQPIVNGRRMYRAPYRAARWSVVAGILISGTVACGWAIMVIAAIRRRRADEFLFVMAPLLALLTQLEIAWRYPLDDEGVVKAHYLQFACAPLFACAGIVIDAIKRRWLRIGAAFALSCAIAVVASYTVLCRFLTTTTSS